jgi:hypothetical protein
MYAFNMDFNLKPKGADAEPFLARMIREWPDLYRKVDGVIDVVFLGNAFGLAGDFTFRMVVEMKSLASLEAIDKNYKTDQNWKLALSEWFATREAVRSTIVRHEDGDNDLLKKINTGTGLLYIQSSSPEAKAEEFKASVSALTKSSGAPSRTFSVLVSPSKSSSFEAWHNLKDIGEIDAVSGPSSQHLVGATKLYGILGEKSGALIASA